jgi:hypothetical protein
MEATNICICCFTAVDLFTNYTSAGPMSVGILQKIPTA